MLISSKLFLSYLVSNKFTPKIMAFTGKRCFETWAGFGDLQVATVQERVAVRWSSA